MPSNQKVRRKAEHRTFPLHVDRLETFLRNKGITTLTRSQLVEGTAVLFGYEDGNAAIAAANEGRLSVPAAEFAEETYVDLVALRDPASGKTFGLPKDHGIEGTFVTPYGTLVSLPKDPSQGKPGQGDYISDFLEGLLVDRPSDQYAAFASDVIGKALSTTDRRKGFDGMAVVAKVDVGGGMASISFRNSAEGIVTDDIDVSWPDFRDGMNSLASFDGGINEPRGCEVGPVRVTCRAPLTWWVERAVKVDDFLLKDKPPYWRHMVKVVHRDEPALSFVVEFPYEGLKGNREAREVALMRAAELEATFAPIEGWCRLEADDTVAGAVSGTHKVRVTVRGSALAKFRPDAWGGILVRLLGPRIRANVVFFGDPDPPAAGYYKMDLTDSLECLPTEILGQLQGDEEFLKEIVRKSPFWKNPQWNPRIHLRIPEEWSPAKPG